MNLILPILLFFLFLIWSLFRSRIKGLIGEKKVSSILSFLDGSKYKVINNIVLKSGERTTQIDHIVISDFGIFVIETKNYKGWILGNENSNYWTQVIFKRKEKLYNPIRQNLGHIWALKSHLREYPGLEYKSIIVFPSTANIKVKTSTKVIYSNLLLKTIKSYSDIKLTEAEKEGVFQKIKASNMVENYDRSLHIKSIKRSLKKRESAIAANKCPQCGDDLVIRNGKFGKFLGCSSYPGCKFSHAI
jgi:NADPH-dependent 7-cyano-7-deazaguanine reductase QueF-like protein